MRVLNAVMVLLLQLAPATGPVDVSRLTVSSPTQLMQLDDKKVKGLPARLAWSPDGTHLYLQTREGKPTSPKVRHFVVGIAQKEIKTVDDEPTWASEYWQWKSAQAAPGAPGFRIQVEEQQKTMRATAAPMGGDLARGSPDAGQLGVSTDEAVAVAQQSQTATVWTLRLKGESIGEWINTAVVPGATFGWAPAGWKAVAFVDQGGRVVLMDERGGKHRIADSTEALLPAWSVNGSQVAYLERSARKTLVLKVVDVAQP